MLRNKVPQSLPECGVTGPYAVRRIAVKSNLLKLVLGQVCSETLAEVACHLRMPQKDCLNCVSLAGASARHDQHGWRRSKISFQRCLGPSTR